MKTLLESIINELKLSKASTGDKLDKLKNFEDLKPGDHFYWLSSAETIENAEYTVEKIVKTRNKDAESWLYTSNNPDDRKDVLINVKVHVVSKSGDKDIATVPKGCTWAMETRRGAEFVIWATTKEELETLVIKHNNFLKTLKMSKP